MRTDMHASSYVCLYTSPMHSKSFHYAVVDTNCSETVKVDVCDKIS